MLVRGFLSFWAHPEFLVFSISLWWKRYLQKHVPGAPKRPPASATPAGAVPPPSSKPPPKSRFARDGNLQLLPPVASGIYYIILYIYIFMCSGGSGRFWAVCTGMGSSGWLFAGVWRLCAALGGSMRPWAALGGPGRLWAALGGSGRLQAILDGSGWLLVALRKCGWLWAALGRSGRFWADLSRPVALGRPAWL